MSGGGGGAWRSSTSDTQGLSSSCLEAEAASSVSGEYKCWMSSARAVTSKFNLHGAIRGRGLRAGSGSWEGGCIFHAVPGFEGPRKAGAGSR